MSEQTTTPSDGLKSGDRAIYRNREGSAFTRTGTVCEEIVSHQVYRFRANIQRWCKPLGIYSPKKPVHVRFLEDRGASTIRHLANLRKLTQDDGHSPTLTPPDSSNYEYAGPATRTPYEVGDTVLVAGGVAEIVSVIFHPEMNDDFDPKRDEQCTCDNVTYGVVPQYTMTTLLTMMKHHQASDEALPFHRSLIQKISARDVRSLVKQGNYSRWLDGETDLHFSTIEDEILFYGQVGEYTKHPVALTYSELLMKLNDGSVHFSPYVFFEEGVGSIQKRQVGVTHNARYDAYTLADMPKAAARIRSFMLSLL